MKPTILLCLLLLANPVWGQEEDKPSLSEMDLGELDLQLNNPLTDIWSLTFQNNTSWVGGDALDGTELANVLFFQPFLPFELGKEKQSMLTFRPVLPFVTQPNYVAAASLGNHLPASASASSSGAPLFVDGHSSGLGDIQLLMLAGPNKGQGWIWGAGATFKFPTASEDNLGQGKYQAGPAAMVFYSGKPWVGGLLVQHWVSFAGDSDRADTKQTDIQYILRRSLPNAMSIGFGPTITVDWEADSDNRLTVPIGLGITKTTRWGSMPVKLRAELHYSVISPDYLGTEWNLRLQVTPIISNPFK